MRKMYRAHVFALTALALIGPVAFPINSIAQNMSRCIALRDAENGGREFYNVCAGGPVTLFWCETGLGKDCETYTDRIGDFGSNSRHSIGRGFVLYGACDGPSANVQFRGLDFDCEMPEQDQSSVAAAIKPEMLTCPSPLYPHASRRLGEEGTATVEVTVSADGHPTDVRLVESSGFSGLDAAALERARQCTFRPARDVSGKPISGLLQQRLEWRLISTTDPVHDGG